MLSRLNGPAIAGAIALVVASWLLWRTLPHDDDQPVGLRSSLLVNKAGGYSIRVPDGMRPATQGPFTRVVDSPRTVLITITPTRSGSPAVTRAAVLAKMRSTYRTVALTGSRRQIVDRGTALTSFGRATTTKGVDLRFVLVTVRSRNRSFAISSFASAAGAPDTVVPPLRTVIGSFRVRPR